MHRKKKRLRNLLRQLLGGLLGAFVVGYFCYHTVQGDRGLVALTALQGRIDTAEAELSALSAQRARLEQRVQLLRPDSLDPDMLEEQARRTLNLSRPDELVIPEDQLP